MSPMCHRSDASDRRRMNFQHGTTNWQLALISDLQGHAARLMAAMSASSDSTRADDGRENNEQDACHVQGSAAQLLCVTFRRAMDEAGESVHGKALKLRFIIEDLKNELSGKQALRGRRRGQESTWGQQRRGQLMFVAAAAEGDGIVELKKPQKSFKRSILEGMVAGGVAGVTVETALYPIDTIKTRLQVARSGGGINFKGLYTGLSSNIVGVLPASAIFVGVYEPLKNRLLEILPENFSVAAHLTSGAAGGAAASLVRVPTEVVKQRMQMGQFPSAISAVKTILAKEGFKGLYAGYGSFLLRDLPFDAIQFAIYEQLKIATKRVVKRDLHDSEMALAGAVAGAITGAVTTPLDVIKTRLMTQGSTGQYKGIIDCIVKTSAEEGSMALFKGVGPRVLWIGIGGSIFFGVLEKAKQLVSSL